MYYYLIFKEIIVVEQKLKELLARQLGLDAKEISNDADVINDLGADSLDVVELVMAIEDAFKIEIEEEEYDGKRVVTQLIDLIQSKIA